jgi:colanic acid biosynthesis glycosyl transferase WcaI
MRILIVTRFAPPDEAPTAVLAGELALHLEGEGHDVELISSASGYRKGSKSGLSRATDELICHANLFLKALRAERGDLLLCLSTPACLPVTAAMVAALKRMRFGHWAMDVYPEIAAALGEIRERAPIYKVSALLMNWAYSRADVLVGLDEDMQKVFARKMHRSAICPPWVPWHLTWPKVDPGPKQKDKFTWLYSGNLGRAHEWKCLLEIQALLEKQSDRFVLIFQGKGAAMTTAQEYARSLGLRNCKWNDYVPKEQILDSLFAADVVVATQRQATLGLLWPSKLAVLNYLPRPLLWIGPKAGNIARSLAKGSPVGVFESHQTEEIATWIQSRANLHVPASYLPPSPEDKLSGVKRMAALICG